MSYIWGHLIHGIKCIKKLLFLTHFLISLRDLWAKCTSMHINLIVLAMKVFNFVCVCVCLCFKDFLTLHRNL